MSTDDPQSTPPPFQGGYPPPGGYPSGSYPQPGGYPPAAYPGGGYSPYGPQPSPPHGGLATASLVLGIIGLIFAVIPVLNFVAYPLVLLAIVFGIVAFKWGKAKAGLILGVLGLIATVLWTIAFAGVFNAYDNYVDCVNHHGSNCAQYND